MNTLEPLQRELLEAFSERAPGFFLTGGAALAGFHLGHRTTHDLDLFVGEPRLEEGVAALHDAATRLGATARALQTAPSFRRFLVERGAESVIVDLVHDPTPQGPKIRIGNVLIDSPQEILANKLCALLSRAEIRDLVDACELERAGHSAVDALPLAMRKDGGLTAAQLGWVLSKITIGEDARIPGRRSAAELREWLDDLRSRLAELSLPG